MVAMLIMMGIQSCSKVEKGDVLKYVPSDASMVYYGDLSYIAEQAGIKDGKIGNPLKGVLEMYKADATEIDDAAMLLDCFTGDAAVFMDGQKLWVVAGIKDADPFFKYLEKEQDFDLEDEDGVKKAEKHHICFMVKDNMLFLGGRLDNNKMYDDAEDIKPLLDLGEDSFAENEQTSKMADAASEKGCAFFTLVSLNKISTLADDRDFDQSKTALSMVFSDAAYIYSEANITDDGMTSEAMLLNSKYEPAKCEMPLGTIKAADLKYAAVEGNNIAVALAMPRELIDRICKAAGAFCPTEVVELLRCFNGTIAATLNLAANKPVNTWAAMATAGNNADAMKLGNFVKEGLGSDISAQYTDKYLRVTLPGGGAAKGSTNYASVLDGKVIGVAVDLTSLAKSFSLGGDFKDFGTYVAYGEKKDNSLILKSEWKCKEPVKKLLVLIKNAQAINDVFEAFEDKMDAYYDRSRRASQMSAIDPMDYSYDPYATEPDYLY